MWMFFSGGRKVSEDELYIRLTEKELQKITRKAHRFLKFVTENLEKKEMSEN